MMLTQEYLRECFEYDEHSGVLTWKARPRSHFRTQRGWNTFNAQFAGKRAGCESRTTDGLCYLKVRLNKRLYLVHRLIWTMVVGHIPAGMEVDHQDHDGTNNGLGNLRLVSSSGNKKNRRIGSDNTTGAMGVYWSDKLRKWVAQIWSAGVAHHVGVFESFDDAVRARKNMEAALGFHPNHGNGLSVAASQ